MTVVSHSHTTKFSNCYLEAQKWLTTAAELDGAEMREALQNAKTCADVACANAFEHSPIEQMMANMLLATVNTAIEVVR